MSIFELLYKRILVIEKTSGYNSSSQIEEIKILEISPSGNWVKIQNMNGNKFWKNTSDIKPIEVLDEKDPKPKI